MEQQLLTIYAKKSRQKVQALSPGLGGLLAALLQGLLQTCLGELTPSQMREMAKKRPARVSTNIWRHMRRDGLMRRPDAETIHDTIFEAVTTQSLSDTELQQFVSEEV